MSDKELTSSDHLLALAENGFFAADPMLALHTFKAVLTRMVVAESLLGDVGPLAEPQQAKPRGLVSHEHFRTLGEAGKEFLAGYFYDEGLITWDPDDLTVDDIESRLEKHVRGKKS